MSTLFLALALLAPVASPWQSAQSEKTDALVRLENYPFITDAEGHILVDWYRPGSGHVVKKPDLPVGWYKSVRRAATLPAAVEKKCEGLPAALEKQLLPTVKDYQRLICGPLVILLRKDNSLIVDHIDIARQ